MGIRKAFFVSLAALAVIPVQGAAGDSALKGKFDPFAASQPAVQRVFELMNAEREKAGLPDLKLCDKLCVSARWHAMDMAVGNYFEHVDRQGRTPGQRIQSFGYRFHYCGQNIAGGQKSPEEVVDAWMKSPGHRENILRPEFKEVGIALVENANSKFGTYWVEDFGSP
jgi:uncharacterized protein YkwD